MRTVGEASEEKPLESSGWSATRGNGLACPASACPPRGLADSLEQVAAGSPTAFLLLWGPEFRISLINEGWRSLAAPGSDVRQQPLGEALPAVGSVLTPFLQRVCDTGQPFRGTDVPFPANDAQSLHGHRYISLTISPVRDADGEIGGLLVAGMETTAELRRRRMLERELATERSIADLLQRSLLPDRLPHVPGLAMAARYVPATADAGVGGDWFDVIPLPDGRLGLVIGDVVGHGVASASAMGQLRHALRAYAHEGHGPAAAIERLNRLLEPHEQIATVLYGELDASERRFVYVAAGHPPALLVAADGTARYVEGPRHLPLGTGLHVAYRETAAALERDYTLVLYTDGLIERRGGGTDGLEALRQAAATSAPDVEQFCDRVLTALRPRGHQDDDIALLAVRDRPPPPGHLSLELPAQPSSLRQVRAALRVWLRDAGASAREAHEIIAACGEACMNTVVHSYGLRAGAVELEATCRTGEIHVIIRDRGHWRPVRGETPGFGFTIMRGCSDAIERRTGEHGTEVHLHRRITGGGTQ